jgi:hypothetical protein
MNENTRWLTKLAAAGFFVAAAILGYAWQQTSTPQVAQAQTGTVSNHAVPIGKGPGTTGYGSALPGAAGTVLTSTGASSDPAFSNPPASSVANHSVAIGTGGAALNGAAPGTSGFVLTSNGGSSDPTFQALGPFATAAQYLAGVSATTIIPPSIIYPTETTTTFGTTTAFDFSLFINTAVTLTNNITTMNVSNVQAGKAGTITFIQDGTGGRTTVWNSVFKFSGGTAPTLSTGPSKVDVLSYSCRSATFCVASLVSDVR